MSDNENIKKDKKFKKTKNIISIVSGYSDIKYFFSTLGGVASEQKKKLSILKNQFDDLKNQSAISDDNDKDYSKFSIDEQKEKELLKKISRSKKIWLVLLAVFSIVSIASLVVCISTITTSNLPTFIYIYTWVFFILINLFNSFIFIKAMSNEFLAWQIVNKKHSIKEGGDFSSFKKNDWVWQVLNFNECGKKEIHNDENN
ncbi:hypothetical protein ACUMKS_003537 [Proteus mirabilis]|uniref:hypothetical protein n=2 Tax=Proteus mirabilis TaxID=584 RepID=UPI001A1B77FD|nr:hypothetical protein [Proteus mirabilis]HEM8286018.1 hypothetical protein [Providencia stuartii]EKU3803934.1 hypothetical protein [Proteus mirabilis]ELB2631265.1 hypothetical protein [Proteus mirabilis]MBI6253047.1 hypothetical protein [Proteus mirabilis]MBI6290354.1 hypothetical protein [Proteus mirabilis]